MLLLSARASREIVNAIDANTKTLKSEIGDVKEAPEAHRGQDRRQDGSPETP